MSVLDMEEQNTDLQSTLMVQVISGRIQIYSQLSWYKLYPKEYRFKVNLDGIKYTGTNTDLWKIVCYIHMQEVDKNEYLNRESENRCVIKISMQEKMYKLWI